MKGFSIIGIGTDVGKTVVSASIVEAIKGVYFKPIQAGDLDNSDSIKVKRWCSAEVKVEKECYQLTQPIAPHEAAKIDGKRIKLRDISFPKTEKPIVLEGAGGILVPLNDEKETILDIHKKSGLPAIVVSRHYLGSINHTLLTIKTLQNTAITIKGIVYVGAENPGTESIIEAFTNIKMIGRIILPTDITSDFIKSSSKQFEGLIYEIF